MKLLALQYWHLFFCKLRMAQEQGSSMKKALVDLWQLAFSYQVNPLAIAQPLSGAARGVSWFLESLFFCHFMYKAAFTSIFLLMGIYVLFASLCCTTWCTLYLYRIDMLNLPFIILNLLANERSSLCCCLWLLFESLFFCFRILMF